jgi:hypothetical protein
MRKLAAFFIVLSCALFAGNNVRAESDIELAYDIFSRGDSVMVWLDLSPFLTDPQIARLNDGIDLLFQYNLRLAIPRRLWGDVTVTETEETVRMSYHLVTHDYALTSTYAGWHNRHFPTLDLLTAFLADSINAPLLPTDSMNGGKRYTLDLKITTIAVTGFNPTPESADSSGSDSPLRFLFKKFLSLTGFGRREFETKSRPFSRSEILPEQTIGQ